MGGLIEKISAAYRVGIPKIFIPKSNKKDLKDLPPDILKKTKFIFVDSVDDVKKMPSQYKPSASMIDTATLHALLSAKVKVTMTLVEVLKRRPKL